MKFKQTIQIGRNVTYIMKLPCVSFVSKDPQPPKGFEIPYYYHLYPGLMWDYKEDLSHRHVAVKGDWLCEDSNGKWHALSDEEYREMERRGTDGY